MNNDILKTIERIKGIPAPYTFAADSSVRALDLLCRTFCMPQTDQVVTVEPSPSFFSFVTKTNHVVQRTVALDDRLCITADQILKVCNAHTQMVWICTPNSDTATVMAREEVKLLLSHYKGYVVIYELLCDYDRQRPLRMELPQHPRLIVLSEPGLVFAQPEVISHLHQFDDLYLTQKTELPELADPYERERQATLILQERDRMMEAFRLLPLCQQVFPSGGPFFMVNIPQSEAVCRYLSERGISLSALDGYPHFLRIPVGTRSQNNDLIGTLRQFNLNK